MIRRLKTTKGATVVEFGIIAIFFFSLLGGIFDIGLTMYRENTITHATTTVARELAVSFTARTLPEACAEMGTFPNSCPELQHCAEIAAKDYLAERFGTDTTDVAVTAEFIWPGEVSNGTSRALVRLNTLWTYSCFFCLALPQSEIVISAKSRALIDDIGFLCTA